MTHREIKPDRQSVLLKLDWIETETQQTYVMERSVFCLVMRQRTAIPFPTPQHIQLIIAHLRWNIAKVHPFEP